MQSITLYDELIFPLESAGTMASQLERIASLETTASHAKWVLGIFIPLVIIWGAFITMNVIAMKQRIEDGGNTRLVTELKSPKSPEQLKANLTTITAQIQTARANGVKPDEKKIQSLAGALTEVVKKDPQSPEAWMAAAELVSFRSPSLENQQSNCFDQHAVAGLGAYMADQKTGKIVGYGPDVLKYSDCTFLLSDIDGFNNSISGKALREHGNGEKSTLTFILENAHLVYRGGSVIYFTQLECIACTYDFNSLEIPAPAVQKLTRDLLIASDYADIKIKLQGAM